MHFSCADSIIFPDGSQQPDILACSADALKMPIMINKVFGIKLWYTLTAAIHDLFILKAPHTARESDEIIIQQPITIVVMHINIVTSISSGDTARNITRQLVIAKRVPINPTVRQLCNYVLSCVRGSHHARRR